MTQTYLEKVELSNFRVYGHSFSLTLPRGPGITVISGPNGLGKTTLFDGIEWCLTGTVSRLRTFIDGRRRQPDHLTRIGAPDGSHRVSLYFSDGEPLDRGLGFSPDPESILRLLKNPNWPQIGDLDLYLSITHFLGQSAAQRFSVRAPREQWQALKGPAGVDRINYIKDRIGGQSARQAFTRAIQHATEALKGAQAELAAWEDLLDQRNRLQQLSVSTDAIDPKTVTLQCGRYFEELSGIDPDAIWPPQTEMDSPEDILLRFNGILADSATRIKARLAQLNELSDVPRHFEAVLAELSSVRSLESEAQARLTAAAERAAQLAARQTAASESLQQAQKRHSEAQTRVKLLARIVESGETFTKGIQQLATLDGEIARSDEAIAQFGLRRTELARAIDEMEQRYRQQEVLAGDIKNTRNRLGLVQALVKSSLRLQGLLLRTVPREDRERLQIERSDTLHKLGALQAEIAKTRLRLQELDERTESIAAAVTTIAAHLTSEDTQCPVCATSFPIGALVSMVQSRKAAVAPIAQQLGGTLADQQKRASALQTQISEIDTRLREVDARIAEQDATEALIADLRRRLADAGALEPSLIQERTLSKLQMLEATAAALNDEISNGVALDDLREAFAIAETEAQAEAARRSARIRARSELGASIDAAQALLRQHPNVWSPTDGYLSDITDLRRNTAKVAAELEEQVSSLRTDFETTQRELVAARELVASESVTRNVARKRGSDLLERRTDLIGLWETSGLSGEPKVPVFSRATDKASESLRKIEQIEVRLRQLVAGYRRWIEDTDLAERQTQIKQRLESTAFESEADLSSALIKAVLDSEFKLNASQRARVRVDEVVSRLQIDADQYADQVLRPLNDTIQRFSHALMTRADGGSIAYKAEHHANRSELKSAIIRTSADGEEALVEMNPNLFFSEGQLSALSVSALLAASTTFSWSRWRGLLMDDPLQHNDVIHASAFVDLLRQLVRRLDYQIIVSTHDANEAEFVVRKCESAGVPFSLCELQPHGEDGLISDVA